MRDDIENILNDEFDKIDDSMLSDNLSNDISKMVHEQNEKVVKEAMKKEMLQTLDYAKATGANICYTDDMSYEELEKIVDDYE